MKKQIIASNKAQPAKKKTPNIDDSEYSVSLSEEENQVTRPSIPLTTHLQIDESSFNTIEPN